MSYHPQILTRSQGSSLSDTTHSSRSSAEKYNLDDEDPNPILLYHYRGVLKTSSQKDLCAILEKSAPSHKVAQTDFRATADTNTPDEFLRVTKKSIPRFTSYISVQRHDLYLPEEKRQYAEYPNYDSNLASIKIPSMAYWSRAIFGSYQDLYIVSPETSPSSSRADEDSRRTSPTNTWRDEDEQEQEAQTGDMQHIAR